MTDETLSGWQAVPLLLLMFVLSFFWSAWAWAQVPELFILVPENRLPDATPEQSQRINQLRQQPTTKTLDLVRINVAALNADQAKLTLSTTRALTFSKKSIEKKSETNFIWEGTLPNGPGTATIVVREGNATGAIRDNLDLYRIEPIGGGVHALIRIDQSKFPPDEPPSFVQKEREKRGDTQPRRDTPKSLRDVPVNIDVLVAYTPSARGAVADIDATIQLAVAETNQSYVNSGINIRLNLVDSFQITYTEAGKSFDTILTDFVSNTDVNNRRNSVGADIAALIINQSDYCGMADAIMANESTAFAIIHYSCATGYYSFAHELGHLMGARHNETADPTPGYCHGYQYTGTPSWRTIMAYDCPGGCPRLQYWSNPNVNYNGIPMGTAATNDNARCLNENASTVAGFRTPFSCGSRTATYTVRAGDNRLGIGVRCVKVQNLESASQLIWYGEGQWQGQTYRHVGEATPGCADQPLDFCGAAADIHGNGESFNNRFPGKTIEFKAINGSWPAPDEIRVSGAWNEVWHKVSTTFSTALSRPTTCGSNFDEYTVSDLPTRQGEGLRCVLRNGRPPYTTAWFGNGEWNGTTYSHLGIFRIERTTSGTIGGGTGGASNLCGPAFGQSCNNFPVGSLRFMPICESERDGRPIRTFQGFKVQGSWSEVWDFGPDGPC